MGTTTTNLSLYKPSVGETGWGTLVNGNFDTLDGLALLSGSWTPTAGGTSTYFSRVATYRKIGTLVWVYATFQINAIGSGSANILSGFPFPFVGNATAAVNMIGSVTSLVHVILQGIDGTSTAGFAGMTAAGPTMTTQSVMANATSITFSMVYVTS